MLGMSKSDRADRLDAKLQTITVQLAEVTAALQGKEQLLGVAEEYEKAKHDLTDLQITLDRVKEDHARAQRETEHKLGLHRKQVEAESEIMLQKAEAERIRAVEEAKLAVREGNLDAERTRFEQEIEFRTKRFEEEAATLRDLTGQILQRLPNVTASFTQHVGPEPKAIEAGE